METEAVRETAPETEETRPKGFFSRLGGIYSSPAATFKEIGGAPRVLVPIIVMIVIGLLVGFCVIMTVDLQSMAVSQLEMSVQQGSMTKQQMAQALPIMSKVMGGIVISKYLLEGLMGALVLAGYIKLFSLIIAAENRFKAIFSVTLFATIAIKIIQWVLLILISFFKRPMEVDLMNLDYVVTSSLGGVLSSLLGSDALPKFFMKLTLFVDAFAIWFIVLVAIGCHAVSRKLKTGTAAIWIAVPYGLLALLSAAMLARFS